MTEQTALIRLERAERKVRLLENMVEDKTRALYRALQDSQKFADFMESVSNAMPVALIVFDQHGRIVHANENAEKLLDYAPDQMLGKPLSRCFAAGEIPSIIGGSVNYLDQTDASALHVEARCVSKSGELIPTLVSATSVGQDRSDKTDDRELTVCILNDLRQQHQREADLRQTQKLETLGRLAAGIAHEINTPAQYVNDSLDFIRDALSDIDTLVGAYRNSLENSVEKDSSTLHQLEDELDIDYVLENAPEALKRAITGLHRISSICRSIKEFSHPSGMNKNREDINRRILETLEIGRNEYKYVAQLETSLGEVPLVECYGDEIGQVVLNIVVNAAHAIEEKYGDTAIQGKIRVASTLENDEVRISISDNGGGIPKALEERIFDTFFTTKQAGRGSGQGLALARSTIEDRHSGRITVNSVQGTGTTFDIYLPLEMAQLDVVT